MKIKWDKKIFNHLYLEPSCNGLNRPRKVRGIGYKMINMGELFANDRIKDIPMELVPMNDKEIEKYSLKDGDLLFARQSLVAAGAGKCSIVIETSDVTTFEGHLIRVRLNANICDPLFYYYYFRSPLGNAKTQSLVMQVAAAGIRGSELAQLLIEYPPLAIQQEIASILSAYDDLIENNIRRIKILEEMAKLIYREWFVDFNAPGVKLRKATAEEKKVTGKDLFPEGWEIKSLFESSDVIYGFAFNSKLFSNIPNGKPLIRIRNLKSHNSDTYTPETPAEKYLVKNGDLLVGMDGDFHFVKWAGGEAYQNQRIVKIRPKDNISKYYLYHSLVKSIKYFDETVVGTTVAHLSDEDLRTINIILPSKNVLDKINEVLNPLFDLEINLISKNQNLRHTRDLLLPKLVSGDIEV